MEERDVLIQTLLKHFIYDLSMSAKPLTQEETIDFVCVLKDYLKGIYNEEPPIDEFNYEGSPFDGDEFIELNLLKPYREKMVPFSKTQLKYYFAKDDYTKGLLFSKLGINEPIFNEDEYQTYIFSIYSLLQNIKENLYLRPIEGTTVQLKDVRLMESEQGLKSRSTEYTRSRQVLLYYFILKLMGITKLDNSSRKLAQFAHVLFAYPIDNIDNSAIYKLLKQAPYFKKEPKVMLKDLEFVKQQFELIDSAEGVALVQREIELLKR